MKSVITMALLLLSIHVFAGDDKSVHVFMDAEHYSNPSIADDGLNLVGIGMNHQMNKLLNLEIKASKVVDFRGQSELRHEADWLIGFRVRADLFEFDL